MDSPSAPIYLVPSNRGSLEHPFHFMLGYFLPVLELLFANPELRSREVVVRSCGPNNHWFRLLGVSQLTVVQPGLLYSRYLGWLRFKERETNSDFFVLPPYDHIDKFSWVDFSQMREQVIRPWLGELGALTQAPELSYIVLDRKRTPQFFRREIPEIPSYGPQRRKIPNISALARQLGGNGRLIDGATNPLLDTLSAISTTKNLIGQYGAGLTHMLWLPEDAQVFEICPPAGRFKNDNAFKFLASSLNLRFTRLESQPSPKAPIDVRMVAAQIDLL